MEFQFDWWTCGFHGGRLRNGFCVRSFKVLQVFSLFCLKFYFNLYVCAGHIFYRLRSILGNVTKRLETIGFLSKYLYLRLTFKFSWFFFIIKSDNTEQIPLGPNAVSRSPSHPQLLFDVNLYDLQRLALFGNSNGFGLWIFPVWVEITRYINQQHHRWPLFVKIKYSM